MNFSYVQRRFWCFYIVHGVLSPIYNHYHNFYCWVLFLWRPIFTTRPHIRNHTPACTLPLAIYLIYFYIESVKFNKKYKSYENFKQFLIFLLFFLWVSKKQLFIFFKKWNWYPKFSSTDKGSWRKLYIFYFYFTNDTKIRTNFWERYGCLTLYWSIILFFSLILGVLLDWLLNLRILMWSTFNDSMNGKSKKKKEWVKNLTLQILLWKK